MKNLIEINPDFFYFTVMGNANRTRAPNMKPYNPIKKFKMHQIEQKRCSSFLRGGRDSLYETRRRI
jgi:hypothetical protein